MITEDELRSLYFKFYDRIIEPYRNELKKNWDFDFAKNIFKHEHIKTMNLKYAIYYGFDWEKSPQGHDYWNDVALDYESIVDKNMNKIDIQRWSKLANIK